MEHECKRCGRCCMEVGRTFWKGGNLTCNEPFGEIKELKDWANDGDYADDSPVPCEMLEIDNGLAVCMIELVYGKEYKPIVCQNYPEDGDFCFRQEAFRNSVYSVVNND